MTASVSMIANDRAQISEAHVQDGLSFASVINSCECRKLPVLIHLLAVQNYIVFAFVLFSVCCICFCIVLSISGGL